MNIQFRMLTLISLATAALSTLFWGREAAASPVSPTYGLTVPVPPESVKGAGAQFGVGGATADWQIVKAQIKKGQLTLPQLYRQSGLLDGGTAWVLRWGKTQKSSSLYYAVARFNQAPASAVNVYDRLGNLYLIGLEHRLLPCLSKRQGARRFALTSQVSETSDVKNQLKIFGGNAKLVDWDEIKSALQTKKLTLRSFYQQTGLVDMKDMTKNPGDAENGLLVQKGGQRFTDGRRHYFIARFDSGAPGYFLVHDSVGSLYLGSWYDMKLPILGSLP